VLNKLNDTAIRCIGSKKYLFWTEPPYIGRAGEKRRSDCPGQVTFAPGQVKMEVWWSGGQVQLALVAWINLKYIHLCYSPVSFTQFSTSKLILLQSITDYRQYLVNDVPNW